MEVSAPLQRQGLTLKNDTRNEMSTLKRILRELTQEIERLSQRNEMLERRLTSITGALQGAVRAPRNGSGWMGPRKARRGGRRGAPPKFSDAQAAQLRREYEKGATSARLARKYKAALPTILGTLRRAGTSLRRGRPPKRK
jgi:DNA-directed RNA polymerase specialized sigma54-like protein